MKLADKITEERLALARNNIGQVLEDADFFLNRLNYFLFENHEEMREDAISFIVTMMDCLEGAEKALEDLE